MCREVGLGAVESNRLGEEKLNNQGSIMKIIKQIANKYKHKIPNNAYTSLINYSVEEYD